MDTNIRKATIADQAQELARRVSAEDYYQDLFEKALRESGMTRFGIWNHNFSDEQLVRFANKFWDALPDHEAIRRGPFFLLCDIAEHIFDDGPESEGGEL